MSCDERSWVVCACACVLIGAQLLAMAPTAAALDCGPAPACAGAGTDGTAKTTCAITNAVASAVGGENPDARASVYPVQLSDEGYSNDVKETESAFGVGFGQAYAKAGAARSSCNQVPLCQTIPTCEDPPAGFDNEDENAATANFANHSPIPGVGCTITEHSRSDANLQQPLVPVLEGDYAWAIVSETGSTIELFEEAPLQIDANRFHSDAPPTKFGH